MKKRQDMPGTNTSIPPAEMQWTELQARQIDLETQNEELLQARDLLEESRDRYIDFYDFSPVGYLTLSHKALITEINLTGAAMLGDERSNLRRRRFAEFLALEDNDFWNRHFMAARQHEGKLTCELCILRGDGSRMDVQIDSLRLARSGGEPMVRLALTDITERKRTEAALRASEAQRRLLEQQKIIQTSLDGFWVARVKDARILEANDAFCNMVGYSRAELLTMFIFDLEVEESPAETAAHIQKVMELGYDRFETRHRHKQGHLVNLEVSVSYSESDGGVNFVFTRDITERKFAEQYERFRSHILELLSGADSLPDILEDIVRGVEQLSPRMICSILLLEGNRLDRGIAPSLPDFYNAAIEGVEIGIGVGSCGTAAASGERVIVADIQTHPYWAPFKELAAKAGLGACWSQPIRSSAGQVLGTFAIYHREAHTPTLSDISIIEQAAHLASIAIERKQAEALLMQREREFRTLAENIPDTLIRYDREGRRTYINPALKRISAVRDEQMIGLTQQESNPFIMPKIYRQALEHTLATGERSELELPIPTPSGDIRTNLVSIVAERAMDGQISGAITIGHDITERKRAEQQLRELAAHLQTAREEEKAHLARELHDDLGQILFLMKLKIAGYDCDCAANSGALCAQLQEAQTLTDRAIGTARNIVSALRPPALDYGIAAALKWLVENFVANMSIQCELQIEDEEIRLDESKSLALFRIVQEALNNVVKHAQADRVEIVLNKDAVDYVMRVRDNGTGFDTNKNKKGSFGLVGMRERTLMHGGTVSIESRSGGGTEIVVRIPAG